MNLILFFRIDVYFTEHLLAVEIDAKVHPDSDLIFKGKRQEAIEKKLGCKFIKINTNKHYDEDYEVGRTKTFISKFKNRQLGKLQKESNEKKKIIRRKNKKIKISIDKLNHTIK